MPWIRRLAVIFAAIIAVGCQTRPVPDAVSPEGHTIEEPAEPAAGEASVGTIDPNQLARDEKNKALIFSVAQNDAATTRKLLALGADPKSQDSEGWAALVIAAASGSAETLQVLLEAGASPRTLNPAGISAIAIASYNGFADIVRLLLNAGVDPDEIDESGWVPLAAAAANGQIEVVRVLLREGADIDAGFDWGRSALMMAAFYGHKDVVQALLSDGANPEAISHEGVTALGAALGAGEREIAQLLIAAAAESQKRRGEPHQQIYEKVTSSLVFSTGPHSDQIRQGKSMYYGEYTHAQGVAGSLVVIILSGGDLTIVYLTGPPISTENPQPCGQTRHVGTYNPSSNRFTEIPDEWIVMPSPGWIMGGGDGVYRPETGHLEGQDLHNSTWANGSPVRGAFSYREIEIPEVAAPLLEYEPETAPTLVGLPGTFPLSESAWTGSFACGGTEYELTLTIVHQDDGRLTGTFAFRPTDSAETAAAFRMVGTYNPSTGRLTLGPTGWVGVTPPAGYHDMYYVDGHYHQPPDGLVIRIVTGSGPCEGEALVRMIQQE